MRPRIIIIEDDDDLRGLMRVSLEAAGYDVIAQSNGNDDDTISESTADLYVIDINLGGRNGLDICKQIKARHHIHSVPYIIMISANPDVRQLALEACADDTLPKPFNAKQLLNKLAEHRPQAQVA